MATGQGSGMSSGGCNKFSSVMAGLNFGYTVFPCLSQLGLLMQRTGVKSQILLSRAHTCLWEREDPFFSCLGFQLFPCRLHGGGDRLEVQGPY